MMPGARSSSAELRIAIQRPAEVIALQARARAFAAAAGLANVACWEVAIAVSEAATNMIKFAGGGIAHLEEALVDNISEGVDAREVSDPRGRRGLGLGLGAIKRLMDEVEIDSAVGEGTTIRARKWIPTRS